MRPRIAITRQVSSGIVRCELTHLAREEIDVQRARAQHRAYEARLSELGCAVRSLPAEPELPDSVFVEDAAVVLDEVALITRPGVRSRRPETASIAEALKPYRTLWRIEPPGTLDGGDVLSIGRALYIGLSGRSNEAAIDQVRRLLFPLGYNVTAAEIRGCLHLKSAVTQVRGDAVLVNPDWVDPAVFAPLRAIEVDSGEPRAANALLVGDAVVCAKAFPLTRQRLVDRGIEVCAVDASELAKAEGGVTCCSLVFDE